MNNLTKTFVGILAGATLLAACTSSKDATEENFSKAISTAFDSHGALCFAYLSISQTFADDDEDEAAKEERALAKAGLVDAKPTTDYRHKPAHAFNTSVKGDQLLHNGRFCFGKGALQKVVKWDSVENTAGLDASSTFVYYTYKIVDVPGWATPELIANQRYMREAFAGADGHTVMRASITRMGDAWSLDNFGVPVSGGGI